MVVTDKIMRYLLALIFILIPIDTFAAKYSRLALEYESVGVFRENKTYQWKVLGLNKSNRWVDATKEVDWYVEPNPLDGQSHIPITINKNGLTTFKSKWGRANVSACYPKGCYDKIEPPVPPTVDPPLGGCIPSVTYLLLSEDSITKKKKELPKPCKDLLFKPRVIIPPILIILSDTSIKITTSMTVMNVTSWRAPDNRDKALASMPLKAEITAVSITESWVKWAWKNGFDGLLWAIYSKDGGKTYAAWGWDYVTKNHDRKHLNGYPRGWVGTVIGSCGACDDYPRRTNVYFTNTY